MLITKPPSWGHCTANITGTPSTSVVGTAITAAANDADGASVSFLANVTHDVEFLVIGANGFNAAAGNGSVLLDILVDPAGGTTWATDPLINDLLIGETLAISQAVPIPHWYYFPIWVKSGNSIGGRARTAHTSDITAGEVVVFAYGGNANPSSWWCGTTVETIGVDDTISQGTTHTAGNSGAFSSWTNFGTALSNPCGALQFAVHGTNTNMTQGTGAYHFEFGVGSTRIGPPIYRGTTTGEAGWSTPTGPIFKALPTGTQMMVRGTCSTTALITDVAAYAVL